MMSISNINLNNEGKNEGEIMNIPLNDMILYVCSIHEFDYKLNVMAIYHTSKL